MADPVRQPIDLDSLSTYIDSHIPAIKLPISIKQFGFGQSNPTYQLTAHDGHKFVLRKKPPGKLLSKTAHQVEREYRIIHALEQTDVPVPKAYGLCEDEGVIGTPFYIMEFLDGRIFEDMSFPGVSGRERSDMCAAPSASITTQRKAISTRRTDLDRWRAAIHTLAKLHRVSPSSIGVSTFGKPSGFYDRQLKTLSVISDSQSKAVDIETHEPVGKIPHFDEMVAFFRDPKTRPVDRNTIVHGDFKIDNLIYHKTETRVIGILDWEMSTLGHPLSDLSNLLGPYTIASAASAAFTAPNAPTPLKSRINPAFTPPISTPGLPSREQLVAWYAEVAGWDPSRVIAWGDAFGVFRNSVIMQGIAARWALRQASSERAMEYAVQMRPFGELAWGLCRKLKDGGEGKMGAKL